VAARAAISALLVVLTAAVYLQVRGHEFVNYDDPTYITLNPNLDEGLGAASLIRAFTDPYEKNWIPLTWISLQLDHALYGKEPAGYLLTNVGLHALSSVLLFLLLCRVTSATGRSAFVAAVFAVHPLHVESVAWASERKDVLSGLFWILTLWAYAAYTERERSLLRYLGVALCLLLGLLAKPMAVTLPFVLLLLDHWPLARLGNEQGAFDRGRVRRALLEKAPLVALVVGVSVVTFLVQRATGATSYGDLVPVATRMMNALASVLTYLRQSVWPEGLAVFYPHPMESLSAGRAIATAIALLGVTAALLREGIRRPYLAVGWLWFLGTLVPVIGLVQVGAQAHADRYMYLPQIGLSIALAWGVVEAFGKGGSREWALRGAGATIVVGLAIVAWHQVQQWRDSASLFERAVAVTEDNFVALHYLGVERQREGRNHEAQRSFEAAVALRPPWTPPYLSLAGLQAQAGDLDGAVRHYRASLILDAESMAGHLGLGSSLVRQGRYDLAQAHLERAASLGARTPQLHAALALVANQQQRYADAARHYRNALDVDPGYGPAMNNLAWLLATTPDGSVRDGVSAVDLAERAVRAAPQPDPGVLDTLAAAYAAAGRFADAIGAEQRAIALMEASGRGAGADGMRARRDRYASGRDYVEPR
jgi:tetratricopeptide (TPR) repeat protein